jgi:protein TonB
MSNEKRIKFIPKSTIMKLIFIVLAAFISGTSWSQEEVGPKQAGEEIAKPQDPQEPYTVVDEQAEFPGGREALMKYLTSNLVYPEYAIENYLEGKCYVRFVVSSTGKVSNVSIVKKVPNCPQCDQEAMRVVKAMPDWKPARVEDKVVNSYYHLPVMFKLTKTGK